MRSLFVVPAVVLTTMLSLAACTSPYRLVQLGSVAATLGTPQASAGIAVSGGADHYTIKYHVNTPHAMELQYSISCPTGTQRGVVGETWESYSTRRIRELTAQREQQAQAQRQVVGAVLGTVQGHAQVQTPNAQVSVDVNAAAVGEVVVPEPSVGPPPVTLGPYDTGAQSIHRTIQIVGGTTAGTCGMALWSETEGVTLNGVTAYMEISEFFHKEREKEERRAVTAQVALEFRATMTADLVARGADPQYQARLRQAEQERLRLAAEARRVAVAAEARRVAVAAEARRAEQARIERERVVALPPVVVEAEVVVTVPVAVRPVVESEVVVTVPVAVRPVAPAVVVTPARPRVSAEVLVALELERRTVAGAMDTRRRLLQACVGGGADIHYQARIRQEESMRLQLQLRQRQEQERETRRVQELEEQRLRLEVEVAHRAQQAELRLQLQLEIRLKREAEELRVIRVRLDTQTRAQLLQQLLVFGADPEYQRKQNEADLRSFEIRSQGRRDEMRIEAQVAAAARIRARAAAAASAEANAALRIEIANRPSPPPIPAHSSRPAQPHVDAAWIAGFYAWQAGGWVWVAGVWSTPAAKPAGSIGLDIGGVITIQPAAILPSRSKPKRRRRRDHR